MEHVPVLLKEVIQVLQPSADGCYVDATVGDGGHTKALLELSSPDGNVLGLDQDPKQLAVAREKLARFDDRLTLVCSRFSALESVAQTYGFDQVDGILFDFGFSSRQIADPDYGLDYMRDEAKLDMRLSSELTQTAADFLNRANEQEIADVLYLYGDRHDSRTLARKILYFRRKKTFQVARDLKEALNLWKPAFVAPIFQAIRIWVNKEFEEIETALPQAIRLLKPGGVLAIITFHSGEDRLVKRFLKQQHELLQVSKFIEPTYEEIRANSRARSAKLRSAQKRLT